MPARAGARGGRTADAAARAGDGGRARLRALLDTADTELRRRGVIRMRTAGAPAPGRARVLTGAIAVSRLPSRLGGTAALAQLPSRLPTGALPDLERLRAELPVQAMTLTGQLALMLRRLAGRDVIDMESVNELAGLVLRVVALRESHRDGRHPVDDFGFDPEWAETLLPIFRILYRRYWRVETSGIANVPRRGGALLVANHAGVLPLDGAMIKTALFEEGLERHARALIATWFFSLPMLSWLLRRTGQTLGHPDDTHRLLRAGELVLVFPEGVRGTGKLWRERYRLRRFGRGGFVEAAIRARVPIIPVSVVGSEEIYPMLADIQPLARLLGMPYFPVTPFFPLLGPLGLIPLPSKWRIEFGAPVRTDEVDVAGADDPATVMRLADEVRDTIQQRVIANLMERRGVFSR